jgi:hypothetical protein
MPPLLRIHCYIPARFHIICSVTAVREALPAPPGGSLPGTGQLRDGQVQRGSHGLQRLQSVLLLGELPEGDEPAGQAGQHLLRHHGDPPVLPHILHLQCALQVGKLIFIFYKGVPVHFYSMLLYVCAAYCTVFKKVSDFPVHIRDVTIQIIPDRE